MFEFLDKLASKMLKLFGIALVGLIVVAVIANAFDDTPPAVDKAEMELYLAYNEAGIYEVPTCNTGRFGDDWVVLCERMGGNSNQGIYEIVPINEDSYMIYAVNGSAKTHASRMGLEMIFNSNSSINIAEVKKELG